MESISNGIVLFRFAAFLDIRKRTPDGYKIQSY